MKSTTELFDDHQQHKLDKFTYWKQSCFCEYFRDGPGEMPVFERFQSVWQRLHARSYREFAWEHQSKVCLLFFGEHVWNGWTEHIKLQVKTW